jgi:hypothetical protein
MPGTKQQSALLPRRAAYSYQQEDEAALLSSCRSRPPTSVDRPPTKAYYKAYYKAYHKTVHFPSPARSPCNYPNLVHPFNAADKQAANHT